VTAFGAPGLGAPIRRGRNWTSYLTDGFEYNNLFEMQAKDTDRYRCIEQNVHCELPPKDR
jgi:hypothetical protein